MTDTTVAELTWKQKVFLAIFVPLILLLALEVLFRVMNLEKLTSSDKTEVQLEMPTWMLKDENALMRGKNLSEKKGNIDWFNIFEEGEGFRVKLIPGIEKSVTNSFSLLEYDKSKKYYIKANSLGFRGPELNPKKEPNTYRILIFGDSSSFGWGVDQSDTFYSILSEELSKTSGKKVEIGNFAIPGDSSEYGKLIVEKYLPKYEADLVIFGFGANDAKKTYIKHKIQVEKFKSQSTLQVLKYYASYSAIFRTFSNLLKPKASGTIQDLHKESAVSQKEYTDNLAEMAKLAKNNNADVLFLNLCTPGNYAGAARKLAATNDWNYFNGQKYLVKRIPDLKNKALLPDLVNEMEKNYHSELKNNSTLYVTSDGCHPNKVGNRLIADRLTAILKNHLGVKSIIK